MSSWRQNYKICARPSATNRPDGYHNVIRTVLGNIYISHYDHWTKYAWDGTQPVVSLLLAATRLHGDNNAPSHNSSRHDDVIKTKLFSALLALCKGNPPVTGGFPTKRPVMRILMFLCGCAQSVKQTVEWPVIRDYMPFMWGHRHSSVAWHRLCQIAPPDFQLPMSPSHSTTILEPYP